MQKTEDLQSEINKLRKELSEIKELHNETEKLSKIGSYKINLENGKVEWTKGLNDIFQLKYDTKLPTPEEFYNYVHPDYVDEVKNGFNNSVINNSSFDLIYKIILEDSTEKTVHSKSKVIHTKDKSRILFGFLRDITEQHRIENQNRLILESTQELISYYDLDLNILWTNNAANASMLNTNDNIIGKKCYEVWHKSSTPCEDCPVIKTKHLKKPCEAEHYTPDGKCWHLRSYPVFDKSGKLIALAEFGMDISKRKNIEKIISESEQKYKKLVEDSPMGIVLLKNDFIQFANSAFLKLCNFAFSKNITHISINELLYNDDKKIFKTYLDFINRTKKNYPTNLNLRFTCSTKKIIHTEAILSEFIYDGENIIQMLIHDVSKSTEIKNKSKYILTDAIYLSRKLSRFAEIKDNLETTIKTNNLNPADFTSILTILREERNMEQLWSIFQQNFELLYEDFFTKLIQQAPDLSQQELKHCAFIKLNFETKDIAMMFNTKPTTVQIGRVRIKKKLKLKQEQDLTSYIHLL